MSLIRFLIVAVLATAASWDASAQIVNDLYDDIDNGTIVLVSATGNGNASGASVEGFLTNQTTSVLRVSIYLMRPIFFVNDGPGQNMVASEVYYGDGDYEYDGRRPFIELQPGTQTAVRFVAYCVEFEKDNPTPAENFSIGNIPADLGGVMTSISSFASANPSMDMTATAQMAIWLAQGESLEDIRNRLEFTEAEAGLARYFIQ